MPSAVSPSLPAGCDGPFDDCAFVNLCSSGQIDNLRALLDAEQRYALSHADCHRFRTELDAAAGPQPVNDVADGDSQNSTDWRYRIARWMLRASDEFAISRETATIALCYADRFLLNKKITRQLYQVVAITCLLVATKLFEKGRIKMTALMSYTQFRFDPSEVLLMEKQLFSSIGTFLFPPTAGTFVLFLLKEFSGSTSLVNVLESCQFMIELAVCDFFFVAHKQSRLAVAATLVTFEQMPELPPALVQACLANIRTFVDFADDWECMACIEQLRKIYTHNDVRIKAVDGSSGIVTTSDESNDQKRVCRAATPSPTPEDQPPELAKFPEEKPGAGGSPRKRQRVNTVPG